MEGRVAEGWKGRVHGAEWQASLVLCGYCDGNKQIMMEWSVRRCGGGLRWWWMSGLIQVREGGSGMAWPGLAESAHQWMLFRVIDTNAFLPASRLLVLDLTRHSLNSCA